ncbi:MAG: NAD(P)-dependent oxidoreductase [Methanoregula sp.]|nr:NAD(P)-dependent oxidoreductase [Methanoregula sp.]
MEMKIILLTGGTGYLGSKILKKLVDNGYTIILLKRSFSNPVRIKEYINKIISYDIDVVPLERIFSENSIDTIIHCATNYGRGENDPLHVIEANLVLPLKLLELGKKYHIQSFINTDTILDKRINYYSLSKKQFKDWLFVYKQDYTCINIALEHFYGSGDDETKFVTYIVHNLLKNVDKIDLTKGEQKRDFIFIDDVVDAFIKIINSLDNFSQDFYEFEVGTTDPVSIKEFVELAKSVSGNKSTLLNFGALPYRENEVMNYTVDISEISKIGWKCRFDVETGLKKMIDLERQLTNQELS